MCTIAKKVQYKRALEFYLLQQDEGALTFAAYRGMRRRGSCRGDGGRYNAQKAAGLGFALLQWFVDDIQKLCSRADATLIMKCCRELKAALISFGWSEADLPDLEGNAGAQWFKRWRQMFGIVYKVRT